MIDAGWCLGVVKKAETPGSALKYERPELRLLVRFARESGHLAKGGLFRSPVGSPQMRVGADHRTANNWLRGACS
jgi:hypothetical protein